MEDPMTLLFQTALKFTYAKGNRLKDGVGRWDCGWLLGELLVE